MPGILKRTIRFEKREQGGKIRYQRFPWNLVETSLGGGWEPVSNETVTSHDPSDEMQRVDKVDFDADLNLPFHYDDTGNKKIKLMGGDLVQGRVLSI